MNMSYIADPHQKKLLKKWGAILESGKKIENESTKIALAQVLENTRNYYKMTGMLNEAGVAQAGVVGSEGSGFGPQGEQGKGVMTGGYSVPYKAGAYGDYYLPNVVMPMLRRIMPDLIANDLVGVQPLNGPVGYALAYRPVYNKNGILGDGTLPLTAEIGYNPTDTRYTGVESKDKIDSDYWKAYAGTETLAGKEGAWQGEGAPLGTESEFANLYDKTYPTVSFGLVKSAVEAKTRKLAAWWSPELAEDMQAMHGIDVEKEMINTLTYEVGAEIDRQIISEMVKAAIVGQSTSDWNPAAADGLD